ncbi:glycoside hydrolase family 78 protein [Paenibacillus beijingensis]|uniref:alpha-L-rhamnosidase n=1 Tax=Paenibacillus beijingensis TaxID=1126833 RepID=A0A0D5NGL1_9BACL|nr:family 78 glycoside hydrolase catalytic domain [Paenibacillus beijingensis]AJY74255.1 alpha-L-rhamnosidase [Paenibacillus beijingensis]
MLTVTGVRCEYMKNPIGIDVRRPRISWKLKSDQRAVLQSAYRIQVAEDGRFQTIVWDSGKVQSAQSVHVELDGLEVRSRRRYHYRVMVWNRDETNSGWSDPAFWETGLLNADEWKAQWIGTPLDVIAMDSGQSPMMRKAFTVEGTVKQATIYASALGLYELEINGRRVGDYYFTPGWTSYNYRLQIQAYEVTELLRQGDNAVGALLGKGWFSGRLAWEGRRNIYGDRSALLVQLHILFEDGKEMVVMSDGSWKTAGSPVLMSEIYDGETYDARLEQPGWSSPGFEDGQWKAVEIIPHSTEILIAQENEPVRKMEEIKPIALIKTPRGETVLDMGQNMVGWLRFSVTGEAGHEAVIHHAEVLDQEGNFYTDNLRSAKQEIRYIAKGGEKVTFEPHFTFHGFRYVRLTGFDEQVDLDDFTGIVLHSDMAPAGSFRCSDALVNQLQHNIEWGMKGNFLDVPTDCPQRDERLGWTGDAQMFIRTAAFLKNVAPFFTKWLRDLKTDQTGDGGVPHVIPHILNDKAHSSAAWGDASVICPWTLYLIYGDKRILEEQYDSMKAWVSYIRNQGDNEFLWNTGFHYGDWLGLDSKPDTYVGATDKDFIATAFYLYSVSLLRKTAAVLNKADDVRIYGELYRNIQAAFTEEFVTPSGRMSVPTQTAQVLALMFGLLDGKAKERAIGKLAELIEESSYHLTTGFVGTPYLNHVLSANGLHDVACKLLFREDYPSWLYQVKKGATTVWEHWDGIKEDGSFWSNRMNSFNHYAYGAIGDWLYRCIAGIDTDEEEAGYKRIIIRPQPPEGLTWAEGRLETMYGEIRCYWKKLQQGNMEMQAAVPPNTTAEIWLPGARPETATESGQSLEQSAGITKIESRETGIVLNAGSGEYRFLW